MGVSLAELEPEPGREAMSAGKGGRGDKKDGGEVLLVAPMAAAVGLDEVVMAVTRASVKS